MSTILNNQTTPSCAAEQFFGSNTGYYDRQFQRMRNSAAFTLSVNPAAGVFGALWFAGRGLWVWALTSLVLETFGWVILLRGLFGDLAASAWSRIDKIESTLALRKQQLAVAIERESDRVEAYQRAVKSLEQSIGNIRLEAQQIEASGIYVIAAGGAMLLLIKLLQALFANTLLERQYSNWLSNPAITSGLSWRRVAMCGVGSVLIGVAAVLHFCFPNTYPYLAEFPTNPAWRSTTINWVEAFFNFCVTRGERFFDGITLGIRTLLDGLELIFVESPWVVTASVILSLTWLSAGTRVALYSGAFLAFMGLLGFWEKAMTTLALLGTAACLSIAIGIPLGIFCARRPKLYAVIQPIMDFMQTMPAFVFMIPVIAFFGTGKPAAVVTTMIFGGTPVVRLTVLGLRGVPESVREAAIAFGASRWYLLTRVDLPLAAPSIRAGVNQTIMLSLAMVVVASLIGAKGLGEDVLEALQYANVGQGILAGFAILFCALILDRIVQGKST